MFPKAAEIRIRKYAMKLWFGLRSLSFAMTRDLHHFGHVHPSRRRVAASPAGLLYIQGRLGPFQLKVALHISSMK